MSRFALISAPDQRVARLWIRDPCNQQLSLRQCGGTDVGRAVFGDDDVDVALRRSDLATGDTRHDAAAPRAPAGGRQGENGQPAGGAARRPLPRNSAFTCPRTSTSMPELIAMKGDTAIGTTSCEVGAKPRMPSSDGVWYSPRLPTASEAMQASGVAVSMAPRATNSGNQSPTVFGWRRSYASGLLTRFWRV